MIVQKRLERYADVLLWGLFTARSKKYKKGNIIVIRYDAPAVGLAEVLADKIIKMGMNPVPRAGLTCRMEHSLYRNADDRQLKFIAPGDETFYGKVNGSIFLHAPESLTHLADVDPGRIATAAIARKPLRNILDKRDEQGEFGWTLCIYPTPALAEHAKMTISEYTGQVEKACFLNRTDPVSHWMDVFKKAKKIKKWLNRLKVSSFHVESKNTDLIVTPGADRRWIGISGHNIPSFELFISPDWRGTRGVYYADQPSFRSGNYVTGVRLEFKKGKAVSISAETGEKFVKNQLAMDAGACKVGEFSLTDRRFSKINRFMANTLFDENFGGHNGNCHIALGASYSDTYSKDRSRLDKTMKKKLGFNDSALHWDLVNTEPKRVTARLITGDEMLIYENGMFCRE